MSPIRVRLISPIPHRFDLWEEISSSSFFTTAVQHRALREGIKLATTIGETSVVKGYTTQAANVLCFLQVSFRDFKCLSFAICLKEIMRLIGFFAVA
jgi:glucoamylase